MLPFLRGLFPSLIAVSLLAGPVAAEDKVVAIGSGEVTGLYYPVAGAVCRLVNKERSQHGLHCLVEPTAGSGSNVAGLKQGTLQVALVQSRLAAQAAAGTGSFKELGAQDGLRSLFAVHGETVALVVRKDSKVKQLSDLKGKRINLGRPGSFQRSMADALLEAHGWTQADFAAALEIEPGRQARALCEGQLDAAVFAGVHPMTEVQAAIEDCGGVLLPIKGAAIDAYLKKNRWLAPQAIGEVYRRVDNPVPSFGPVGVVVAGKEMSDADAYGLVKSVFDNFDAFVTQYPVLGGLDKKAMASEGLALPVHPGAQKFFTEAGLTK